MKNSLITALLLIVTTTQLSAQCNKKITWTGPRLEFIDEKGEVMDTKSEEIVIVTDARQIRIVHGGQENDAMTGTIKHADCHWTKPFHSGKTVYQLELTETGGHKMNGLATLEAKNGKIVYVLEMSDANGKKAFRVPISSWSDK